jgi:dipeptidyl aminopeptidase/acylaminoacyl peptidase
MTGRRTDEERGAGPAPGLDLEALARTPGVRDFEVSREGTIAFSWNRSGQFEVYLLSTEGGEPRPITAGPESKVRPRWSPDGRRLVYAQDFQGDERFDLFQYDPASGETRNLTPDTDFSLYPYASWSPDGRHLAFTSDSAGRFAVYRTPVDGSAPPVRLTDHEYSDDEPHWSPDGQWIALSALVSAQETQLFLVPSAGGAARPVARDGKALWAQSPLWSPDGRRLAFTAYDRGFWDVQIAEIATGQVTSVSTADHDKWPLDWSPDGRRLLVARNAEGNVDLWLAGVGENGKSSPDGGAAMRSIGIGPGVHEGARFTPDGAGVVCLFYGAASAPDLWLLRPGEKTEPRRLTRSLSDRFTEDLFATPKAVRYPSAPGVTVPALLYRPRSSGAAGAPPGVVWIHGGPTWEQRNAWAPMIQHLVSRGCVVLCPNYRGSTGSGRAFQEANRYRLGIVDLEDVAAGYDFLAREGLAEPRRIAVTGGSWGGYLTMCAVTRHPEKWIAGSAVVPFLNWFTAMSGERADLQHWDRENAGDPERDQERLRETSPLFFLDCVRAPVQLIAGAHDPRCPVGETEQAREVLTRLGLPFECVIYPDEGHGFRREENRVDAYRRQATFLAKYLGL